MDFIGFLEDDATLAALLGAGGSNTKFFAQVLPDSEETPAIVYGVQSDGTGSDHLDDTVVRLACCAKTYVAAKALVDRITVIADVMDGIVIASSDKKIFYSKKIGGTDSYEADTRRHVLTRLFHLKFKRNAGV